jgi:hypothetical protein
MKIYSSGYARTPYYGGCTISLTDIMNLNNNTGQPFLGVIQGRDDANSTMSSTTYYVEDGEQSS